MVPFAGYDMPVQYSGIIAESKAVREGAGMFDVSHMARLRFRGDRTLEFLEWITSNDVSKLDDGRGQYSLLPNDRGGCVDDIIVYRISQNEFRMVVNAANHEKDVAWIKAQNTLGVEICDETDATAMIAVQGPRAVSILRASTATRISWPSSSVASTRSTRSSPESRASADSVCSSVASPSTPAS